MVYSFFRDLLWAGRGQHDGHRRLDAGEAAASGAGVGGPDAGPRGLARALQPLSDPQVLGVSRWKDRNARAVLKNPGPHHQLH